MLKRQKKISMREIKEDKLVTTYFEVRTWIENNQRTVAYIVATPLVLIALWFWWQSKKSEWNETASAQISKIIPYYEQGKYDLAINGVPQEGAQGLQSIVDEYGSTTSGEFAKLYLGNSYLAVKNYDKALSTYEGISTGSKMIDAAAYAGAGMCYEAKGKYADAASSFEKAASKDMSEMQAPANLQRSAVNYAAAGEKQKAVELLQTLKKEFPRSTYARDADRFIAEFSS